jgi:hypothetical protein
MDDHWQLACAKARELDRCADVGALTGAEGIAASSGFATTAKVECEHVQPTPEVVTLQREQAERTVRTRAVDVMHQHHGRTRAGRLEVPPEERDAVGGRELNLFVAKAQVSWRTLDPTTARPGERARKDGSSNDMPDKQRDKRHNHSPEH